MSTAHRPRSRVVPVLALGAGLTVSGLYYNQPMLGALATDLSTTPARIGFVPTATQLGYAAGIVLFAPLGDKLDRRRVIVVKCALLAVALALAAAARDAAWLATTSLAIGLAATAAQDLVPAAAAVAEPSARGRTVGSVMTGLLLGILLSRVVSGAVTAYVSWRVVFAGAAVVTAAFAVVAARALPPFPPVAHESYLVLLRSLGTLFARVVPLRRAILAQSLLSFAFSGFWSTLALALAAPPFEMNSLVAGSFGVAGAAGALAAPIAGAIADRRGPVAVIRFGALVTAASFATMAVFAKSIVVLALGTVTFDLGTQSCLIAHQSIVYAQDHAARSRLNALLVGAMFLGMSAGAFVTSRVFARAGFAAVCATCAVAALAALVTRLPAERR